MKKLFLVSFLFLLTHSSFSQSNQIIGSWILQDSIDAMQFFATADGKIQERHGLANENIWNKPQRTGKYTFSKNGKLVITWSDKSIETREVKFEDHFNVAKIKIVDKKTKKTKSYLFLRVRDEEVILDK